MTEFIPQALRQIMDPPKPATPAEARADGARVFPNVPCLTDNCAGDFGHEGDCGPRPVASKPVLSVDELNGWMTRIQLDPGYFGSFIAWLETKGIEVQS